MKDTVSLEMLYKIAIEQNWTIREALANMEMNYVPLSDGVVLLGQVMGLIERD
jgi:hypothetical protein